MWFAYYAFKAAVAETGWNMSHKLSALHTLFDDVPARREEYESITKQNQYPLNFCAHHLVENVQVCKRAMEILPHISKFIDAVKRKQIEDPATKSYETVVQLSSDPFAKAKLGFIVSVAKPVERFLKSFQSDKPMVPFLSKQLEELTRDIFNRFVKPEVMEGATTVLKLISVDIEQKDNQKSVHRINIGFFAEDEVEKLVSSKKVRERAV